MSQFRFVATVAVLVGVLVACGGEEPAATGLDTSTTSAPPATTVPSTTAPSPTGQISTTTEAPSTTGSAAVEGAVVYFLMDELDPEAAGPYLVPVFRSVDSSDPVAVVEALLAGPTSDETDGTPSISTAIPGGVDVLGVGVSDREAAVDLSGSFDDGGGSFSMFSRLAQVTYTLTRLHEVDRVVFHLDGQPVTTFSSEGIELEGAQQRDDYYDLLAPVFVDRPAWGETVTSPLELGGLSNVFEATSRVMLTDDDGLTLDEETVTATCGTGCWGEWQTTIHYEIDRDQFGALIVWADSPEDGTRIHVREYPIQLR